MTINANAQSETNVMIGNLLEYNRTAIGIQGRTENGIFSLEVWNEKMIRVRVSRKEDFENLSYPIVVNADTSTEKVITDTDEVIKIKTKEILLEIYKKPFSLSFKNKEGLLLNEDDKHFGISWIGDEMTVYKTLQSKERFIGLGEKTGPLNRRGNGYTNWNTDVVGYSSKYDPIYSSIPFYIGIKDLLVYGVYLNNSYKSHFNFGAGNERFAYFSVEHGDIDYFFIHGNDVGEIINNYTYLTGRMKLPPIWSLGYHQSRYSYFPDKNALLIGASFRVKKIPCDAITLDIHYMNDYKVFTWHPKRFPNPREFTAQLARQGFYTTVIIDPGIKVEDGYDAYEEGKKDSLFVTFPDGQNYIGEVWPGRCHFPDFTNPKTREWWMKKVKKYALEGVKGYWIDMNEFAVWGGTHIPNVLEFDFDGLKGTMAKARNLYAQQMARATYEGAKNALSGVRPFLLTRAAFSGSQRYTALWTGDNNSDDDHMLAGVRLVNSLGLSGYAFTGFDVGGFTGNPSSELFARWIAIGAFTPFFRGHSAINTQAAEPWAYGEQVEQIARDYIQIRYNFLPYIYSLFYEAAYSGMPITRSLAVKYTFDENIYNEDFHNQFLLGDAILVAPVKSSEKFAKVYLPDIQSTWYDFHSFEEYDGGQSIVVEAGIERLPLFVKSSSVLFNQSPIQYTSQNNDGILYVYVFNGKSRSETLYYEDDGLTYKFEKGDYHKRTVSFKPNKGIYFSKSEGNYNSKFKKIKMFFLGHKNIREVYVNGDTLAPKLEKISFHANDTEYYGKDMEKDVQMVLMPYTKEEFWVEIKLKN